MSNYWNVKWPIGLASRGLKDYACPPLRRDLLALPFHWRRPRVVLAAGDLFQRHVPFEFIAAAFGVMAACPQHTFLICTKHAATMLEWFKWIAERPAGLLSMPYAPKMVNAGLAQDFTGMHWTVPNPMAWPLPNVWPGVEAGDQPSADARIPALLETPAARRWVRLELFGPVDLSRWLDTLCHCEVPCSCKTSEWGWGLDQIVVSGETGRDARKCDAAWLRSIVAQSKDAWTQCYVQHLGSHVRIPYYDNGEWEVDRFDIRWNGIKQTPSLDGQPPPGSDCRARLGSRAGSDPSEWPAELRVRDLAWESALRAGMRQPRVARGVGT
jgi:protein gp37